jgi:Spy/CpxP family protein refolding chaperone
MTRLHSTASLQALVLSTLALASSLAVSAAAIADDAPPPASAPGPDSPDSPKGRHHGPAWQACKKQADDQKLAPGDARRDFMKSCIKSAKDSAPPAS